ncbi:MAG: AAA family ATPase, partial [Rhizobacter sp.]
MANRVAPAANDGARVPRGAEALLLAHLLRLSPLTLLHGEAGAGKTTLITHELLPLLQRRVRDRPRTSARVGRVVVPFPERRRPAAPTEVVVVVDHWDGDPLARLRARIDAALGAPPDPEPSLATFLDGAARRHGVRFLLVLDHFDDLLDAPPDATEEPPFIEALIALLNLPDTPAHVFVVLRDASHPRLRPLHNRVRTFGDRWLRVRHWQVATEGDPPPLRLVTLRPPAAATSAPLPPPAPPPSPEPIPTGQARVAAIAGTLLLGLVGLAVALWSRADHAAPVPPEPPVAIAPPPFGIALDTEGGAPPPMAIELARALSPPGSGTPAVVPPGGDAPFALMRYDELQWRRRLSPHAGLQVVAPLHREVVHVLVSVRSPLRSMADLRGRR